jgi:hypothetical protein
MDIAAIAQSELLMITPLRHFRDAAITLLLRHRVIIIFTPVYFTSSSLLKRHY